MKRINIRRKMVAWLTAAPLAGIVLAGGMTAQAADVQVEAVQVEGQEEGAGAGSVQEGPIVILSQEEVSIEQPETEPGTEAVTESESGAKPETKQRTQPGIGTELAQALLFRKTGINILLIGTDHRDDSWNGNSDVMILATIRPEDQKITMTSFMRDLYADIPGHGVHKLNYAFAVGGGELLEETLEDNYELEIDNYAVVDFESMAEIVDVVGGVEMEISEDECYWLNGYLNSMEAWGDYLPGGGTYVFNGNQAVAFMRIRFVGNNDYQRTQRQRDILKGIFGKLKELDAEQLLELANTMLEDVDHNFSLLAIMNLLSLVPELPDYELGESRIPYDDLYASQDGMLVPDFEATIERLHEELGMDAEAAGDSAD